MMGWIDNWIAQRDAAKWREQHDRVEAQRLRMREVEALETIAKALQEKKDDM